MQPDVVRLVDGFDDVLIVLLVGHKIQTIGVDKQDAHVVLLLTKEVEITLLDVVQIGIGDFLLVAATTLADVGLQISSVIIAANAIIGTILFILCFNNCHKSTKNHVFASDKPIGFAHVSPK